MEIILARHGEYNDSNGKLSAYGRTQIVSLAESIQGIFPDISAEKVEFCSSTAERAVESSEVLQSVLGLNDPIQDEMLYSSGGYLKSQKVDWLKERIEALERGNKEYLLVVTHYEFVNYFFRLAYNTDKFSIARGRAVVRKNGGEMLTI
ncbi:MAG: hypothetical protein LBG59_03735 [Candidatus Peribacteria bacterium]|jgi:phosphohistidine phosphatase SixA|nr:hypothetical protein [Candidatus Peribacteria bacterium]